MNEGNAVLISQELLRKIDQNRGGLSREEFVGLCLDAFLARRRVRITEETYVTREEFEEFQRDIRGLQRSFIDFLITYLLELST